MQILGRVPQSTLSGNYTEIRFDIVRHSSPSNCSCLPAPWPLPPYSPPTPLPSLSANLLPALSDGPGSLAPCSVPRNLRTQWKIVN